MKLLFKQKLFSWYDNYNIFDQQGRSIYKIKGENFIHFGHTFGIYDENDRMLGKVQEKVFSFVPRFEIYLGNNQNPIGTISKKPFTFAPKYEIDFLGWQVVGNILGWDYQIFSKVNQKIATIKKELFQFSNTYSIDVINEKDSLFVVMLTLSIDAYLCTLSQQQAYFDD